MKKKILFFVRQRYKKLFRKTEKLKKNWLNFNCEIQPIIVLLSHQDSNLDRQNQKLQCYHYTMRQSLCLYFKSGAKIRLFFVLTKHFRKYIP